MSETAPRGALTRARMSVDAIRVVDQMRREARTIATPDELRRLLGWSGWGPLAPMFAPNTQSWLDLHDEVKAMLTAEEWEIGNRSTYTSFYTPTHVAQTMWKLLINLGFTVGKVLEPGCGGGAFIGTAPAGAEMIGVDRDPIAAAVTRALYPDAEIITSRFEAAELTGGFDAAIGNVPFGKRAVHDPTAPRAARSSLHNYCIWRTMRELAPGGIAVLLTSRYTMDASADYARLNIGQLADFVGAIRLPNGGLEGGTEALADIVVLRRSTDRRPIPSEADSWLKTHALSAGLSVNDYWTHRPEMVLGTMREGETSQYGLGVAVDGDLAALPGQLDAAQDIIMRRASARGLLWQPAENPAALDLEGLINPDGWQDGSFRMVGRDVIQMVDGQRKRVSGGKDFKELLHLMRLRDYAVELVLMEANHDLPDDDIEPVRRATLACYEQYLATYGPINRSTVEEDTLPVEPPKATGVQTVGKDALKPYADDLGLTEYVDEPTVTYKLVTPRMGGFRKDPDFQLVAALERYDDDTGKHSPAPILTSRQNRRVERPERTDDPMQALAWSMDRKAGGVDLEFIAQALGRPVLGVTDLLGDAVYCDPETRRWLVAEDYLAGNVRAKLRAAEAAAAANDVFERNVTALRGVLPVWLDAHKIKVKMSAVWITVDVIEKFVEHLLGPGARIKRLEHGNNWEIKGGRRGTPAASVQWGTSDRSAFDLIEDALNNRVPVVKTPVQVGDREVMRKDPARSMLAGQKKEEIERYFARWLWTDPARTDTLVNAYNETYNSLVARTFDGSHITIAGLAPWFKPYPHQLAYVARGIATRASLCAHPVGAGKTATMAMLAMKLRELGLINLPMISVPKHLLEQTVRQMRQLFPTANILSVSTQSIGKNRRAFAARCSTGGYDLVVITHPAFDKIRVSDATEARYYQRQQSILDAAIRKASPDGELEPGMVKRAAARSDALDTRIRDLRHRKVAQDSGVITFEQLGVDWLGVDEAQAYKSLALPVRTEGFSIRESKRALDLDMKLHYLSTLSGNPYVALFTGTPISNTMLELYIVLHYLMPEYLQTIKLGTADAWASTFVEFVTSVDVTVDGGGFNLKTRPALFINAPELRMLLSMVADVRTREQLGLKVPEMVEEIVTGPPTAAQAEYSLNLVERAKEVRSRGRFPGPGADNMLKICTDGRMMATDPRLVGIHDPEPGKLHRAAAKILGKWREYPDQLQIVFCDIGTPNADRGDQTYGRLRRLLVEGGMPVRQIEFIHSAKNGSEKARLFSRCRTGNVSVIMGSTEMLGTGTNIQDRVIAMHHVDAPFRPADVEQRDGRGVRPGNKNERVFVFRYITQRTFDAYMWQLLARKIGFITQILTGVLDRTVEDVVADRVLSFAAIKAAATDQPLLIEKADVEAKIKEYRNAEQGYQIGVHRLRSQVSGSPRVVAGHESDLRMWEHIAADYTGEFTDEDMDVLTEMIDRPWDNRIRRVAGLRVAMDSWYDSKNKRQPELRVFGAERVWKIGLHDFQKAGAYRSALLVAVKLANEQPDLIRTTLANHRADVASAEALLATPFEHAEALTAAQARLDQIEAELHDAAAAAQEREVTATDREAIRAREDEIEVAAVEELLAAAVNDLLGSLRSQLATAVNDLLADFRK